MADTRVTIEMLFQAAGHENVRRQIRELSNEIRKLASASERAQIRRAGPAGEAFVDLRRRLAEIRAFAIQAQRVQELVSRQIAEARGLQGIAPLLQAYGLEQVTGRKLFGGLRQQIRQEIQGEVFQDVLKSMQRATRGVAEQFPSQIRSLEKVVAPTLAHLTRVGLDERVVRGQLARMRATLTSESMSVAEKAESLFRQMSGFARRVFRDDPETAGAIRRWAGTLRDAARGLEEMVQSGMVSPQVAERAAAGIMRQFRSMFQLFASLQPVITAPARALKEVQQASELAQPPTARFLEVIAQLPPTGRTIATVVERVWTPSMKEAAQQAQASFTLVGQQAEALIQRMAELRERRPASPIGPEQIREVRSVVAQMEKDLSAGLRNLIDRARNLSAPFRSVLLADLQALEQSARASMRAIAQAGAAPQVIAVHAPRIRAVNEEFQRINQTLSDLERRAGRGFMLRLGQELIGIVRQTWTVHQLSMALRFTGMEIAFMGAAMTGASMAASLLAQQTGRAFRTFEVTADLPREKILDFREQMIRVGAEIGASGEQIGRAMAVWARATGEAIQSQEDLNQVIRRVQPIMTLSAIHGEDMAEVMARVVAVANVFRISFGDIGRIVASFNKVALETPTTLIEIGDAMRFVGPIARNMGMAFEETMAIIQLAAMEGIRGGIAGRALRQMLIRFGEQEQETRRMVQAVFGEVEPFFPEGRFVGVPRFIQMLAQATELMTERQRAQMLSMLATANELPLLEALVGLQREATKWARERGEAEFNVIEALQDVHEGLDTARARALRQFLMETRGITLQIESAGKQWEKTFDAFTQHIATRWDSVFARLRGVVEIVGVGIQVSLLGPLEQVARMAEAFVERLGGATSAAQQIGAVFSKIALAGVALTGIGLVMQRIGDALQVALTFWMGAQSVARIAGAAGLAGRAGALLAGLLSPRALSLTVATATLLATGNLTLTLAGAAGAALISGLMEGFLRQIAPGVAAFLTGLLAKSGLAALAGKISAVGSALASIAGPAAAVAAALAALALVTDRVAAALRGDVLGEGWIGPAVREISGRSEQAARLERRLRWLRERVPGGAELAEQILRRATIQPAIEVLGLAGDVIRLQPVIDPRALEAELDRLGVPEIEVQARVTRFDIPEGVRQAMQQWREQERQSWRAIAPVTPEDRLRVVVMDVMQMAGGRIASADPAVIMDFMRELVWEVPYQFKLASQRTEQAISDMFSDLAIALQREREELAIRIGRMRAQLAQEEQEEEEERNRQRERRRRDMERRVQEMTEDHHRRMRQMEEDHRDRVLDLVAERNALALVQEIRDYAKRRQREEEEFQIRLRRMQQDFEEQNQLEEEDRARRRQQRRLDMERQIAEMIQDFERQAQLRREDAQRRAAQMRAQLDQERMLMYEQMARRLQEQLGLANEFTNQELKLHGQRYADLLRMLIQFAPFEKQVLQKVLEDYLRWLEEMLRARGGGGGGRPGRPGGPVPFQAGGYVPQTMLALVHQGEFVLPAWAVRSLELKLGRLTPERVVAGTGATSVVVNAPVTVAGGDSAAMHRALERHREEIVREVVRALRGLR
ncbi:MAG: phage tail tape measure protein [Anaerolineae bacterium]|nr:phage tail tape measure protein [Anaerolineae bacterium]